MSRTVAKERLLGQREMEVFRRMMHSVAEFSGIEILTYCLMANHFHILVRVPVEGAISDETLVRRFGALYRNASRFQPLQLADVERILAAGGEDAERLRRRLTARMSDVSQFMKTLKQRFSIWYNRTHGRIGTLWAERFKSVLVEGGGNALQTIAAYIDLNPVRAGLVDDPKDYRFCGYAEAVAGKAGARAGLRHIWIEHAGKDNPTEGALVSHRSLLFGKGAAVDRSGRAGRTADLGPPGHPGEPVDLSLPEVLRCRVRYFTDGAILGSAEFVRSHALDWQIKRRRQSVPRPNEMRGGQWRGLCVIGNLKSRVLEHPKAF